MEKNGHWGDFSDWLKHIDQQLENDGSRDSEIAIPSPSSVEPNQQALKEWCESWLETISSAPLTTWKEELEVRGWYFPETSPREPEETRMLLDSLLECMSSMRIFFTNSDHLSDGQFYELIVRDYIREPVPHVHFDEHSGYRLDVVATAIENKPEDWLSYYASSRERMEWAKQNPGAPLPPSLPLPYPREDRLPKP